MTGVTESDIVRSEIRWSIVVFTVVSIIMVAVIAGYVLQRVIEGLFIKDFGMDILQKRGPSGGYYIGSREFELPELKLLVDAVQSSKFITESKTVSLIRKIEGLTSVYEARGLQRQVVVQVRHREAVAQANPQVVGLAGQIDGVRHGRGGAHFENAQRVIEARRWRQH